MCEKSATWQLQSDLRLKINETIARREKTVQVKKLTKAIKSITDQHQYFYNVDSLLQENGSITKYPVQIHNKLTGAFAEYLVFTQHLERSPLQADDGIENERFLTDKEYSKTTAAHITTKIHEDALESIWYGISHVLKRTRDDTRVGNRHLHVIVEHQERL